MTNVFFSTLLTVFTCTSFVNLAAAQPPNHLPWDNLLKKYVDNQGNVNYKGLQKDSTLLNGYLETLQANHPEENKWSKEAQMAYWINAYNAFTVKLILDHYPVKSIKDIKRGIPFINTVWDIKFIKIGTNTYDLNNIEHTKLRSKFKDPRIHFAVNCASYSCPALRNEAYTAEKLELQLTDATKRFLADGRKNQISPQKVKISKLFFWYKGDFTRNGSTVDFINAYSPVRVKKDASIEYQDYLWNLNE
jgi:Protein of unknown function, DUF547